MKLTDGERAWLDGYLEAYEDLPDGAFQVACVDAIGSATQFRGRDPTDVWLAWVVGPDDPNHENL